MIKTKGTGGYQLISCDFSDLTDIAIDQEPELEIKEGGKNIYVNNEKCTK